MRKLLCFFLIFCSLIPLVAFAQNSATSPEAFTPSPTIEDLYVVLDSYSVSICENSEFDYASTLKGFFSDKLIDCIPLTFNSFTEEYRSERFNMAHPSSHLWAYDCFITDINGNILGNVTCKYLESPYGDWWYDVFIIMAPNKYEAGQVVYLVWIEE